MNEDYTVTNVTRYEADWENQKYLAIQTQYSVNDRGQRGYYGEPYNRRQDYSEWSLFTEQTDVSARTYWLHIKAPGAQLVAKEVARIHKERIEEAEVKP
jgi:hypothetical protein